MSLSSLFGPWEAASFIYGAGIGAQAPVHKPRTIEEAQARGSIPNLLGRSAFDVGIGLIDDLAIPAAAIIGGRWVPWLRTARPAIMKATGILGFGISGGLLAKDTHEYLAARAYLAQSQSKVPDSRINPITGFINKGPVGEMRTLKTGIGSPAAGGIFYRMNHNPFADLISTTVSDDKKEYDPRIMGLEYAVGGSILGGVIGATKGLGKASALSLTLGAISGMYGIYSAHNSSATKNIEAAAAISLFHPGIIAGGLLFGASSIKGNIGKTITSGMEWAKKRSLIAGARASQFGAKHEFLAGIKEWDTKGRAMSLDAAGLTASRRDIPGMVIRNSYIAPRAIRDNAYKFGAGFMKNFVAPTLMSTGLAQTKWESSLGFGTLASHIIVPTAAAVIGYKEVKEIRGKHSHNLMS